MAKILIAENVDKILENIDVSRLGNNVGIKVHFGEKGCVTHIDPKIVKAVYDKVISLGKKCALIETNVLYRGSRTNTTDHLNTAKSHDFDFAPIDILDGEMGDEFIEVKLDNGLANPVKIAKGVEKYDSLIVLTHFKGHMAAGYGGAFKNIGMGMGSRAGKLHMHSDVSPTISKGPCTGCGICVKNCDFDAITITDGKAEINPEKCAGCAMCIAVCPTKAPQVPWMGSTNDDLQKKIVDYAHGVINTIGKDKIVYINVMKSITPECDCMGVEQKPMMDDVGVLMGDDPVALDKACLDLADEKSGGRFDKINNINKNIQIDYACEKEIGSKEYELVKLD